MATMISNSSNSAFDFLEQAKQNFYSSTNHLGDDERRRLWSQATVLHSNSSPLGHAPPPSLVSQTPRTMPCSSMSSLVHFPASNTGSMDRTQSAPALTRPRSITASESIMLERSSTEFPAWYPSPQEPANDYALFSGPSSQSQPQPNLQTISEVATYPDGRMVEYSPLDYINMMEPLGSPPLPLPLPQHSHHVPVQLTSNMQWSPSSSGSASPSTPSTALMTPVTLSSNTMCRQSSLNPHFLDASSMLRVPSDSSMLLPILAEDSGFSFSSLDPTVSPCVDSSLFLSFTGPTSESFLSHPSHVSVSASATASSASASAHALASSEIEPDLAEDMRRSASHTSTSTTSTTSSCSRVSQRGREILAQATSRPLAPKSHSPAPAPAQMAQMAQITSPDGSSKTVGLLSKTPYVRPTHAKIMCAHCNERPDGFRGTHELDRHIARAHAVVRKGYICVAPAFDATFLDACKHCRARKVYGAYYNAAAHLRRAHFHPRKRGRRGASDEKRGGIGGGDDPPMDFLKMHWIRELEVPNRATRKRGGDAKEGGGAAQQQPAVQVVVDHEHDENEPSLLDFGLSMHASEPLLDEFQFGGYVVGA